MLKPSKPLKSSGLSYFALKLLSHGATAFSLDGRGGVAEGAKSSQVVFKPFSR